MRTRSAAVALSLALSLPAAAQRVAAPTAPAARPVLPVSGALAPALSGSFAPTAPLALPAPAATAALPRPAAPVVLSRPAVLAAAAAVLPDARPPEGARLARVFKAVPAALGSLGRTAFEGLREALARAFDGGDARPALLVPDDPDDSLEFNGVRLPRRAFSDQARLSGALVAAIDAARDTLDVAVHGIGLREAAEALLRAKARGVRLRVVMNETHAWPRKPGEKRSPEVQALLDAGVEMRTLRGSREFGVMHNKYLVADGRLVLSGSYNWTRAADDLHLENVFLTDDARRVALYEANWRWMWEQGRPASRRPPDEPTGPEPAGPPPEDPARPVAFNGTALPATVFGPRGPAEAWIAAAVGAARRSVDVAMFSFTSPELKDALAAARARGVKVRLLFDARNAATLDTMRWFIDQGFEVRIRPGRDGRRGVLHNKFAVFDGVLVETGSYNWTENADKNNFENANFFDDAASARGYREYFERMWAGGRLPTAAELERWRGSFAKDAPKE